MSSGRRVIVTAPIYIDIQDNIKYEEEEEEEREVSRLYDEQGRHVALRPEGPLLRHDLSEIGNEQQVVFLSLALST